MKLSRLLFHPRVHWSIHTLRGFLSLIFIVVVVAGVIFAWLNSSNFEKLASRRMVAQIEQVTGGRAELASFHLDLLSLSAEADDLVIHGLEPATEEPYLRVARLHVNFTIFGLLTPSIHLRQLEISRPAVHIIYNLDGTTNIPKPKRKASSDKNSVDELFNLKVGHVLVNDGVFQMNTARSLFDIDARDLNLSLAYQPRSFTAEERYHLETTLSNLNLRHRENIDYTSPAKGTPTAHYRVQAVADLTRTAIYLHTLEIVSNAHRITASGAMHDFSHPAWDAKVNGEFELALLQPLTGFEDAPTGIAHLDLTAGGKAGDFHIDGPIHVDNGSYTGANLNATGLILDTRAHVDPKVMRYDNIVVRLAREGTISGDLSLRNWRAPAPGSKNYNVRPAGLALPSMRDWDVFLPIDGEVNARLNGVTIDTLMDIVSPPTFHRLGLNGLINGPMAASWTGGDIRTLTVGGQLAISPGAKILPGEVAAYGSIDGTYIQRNSSVDLRNLDLRLPFSRLSAHGRLGAYPLSSSTGLNIEFHTTNFQEFDPLLRDLGFQAFNQHGAAALPVHLDAAQQGQFTYKGQWNGSLLDPHLTGTVNATQIAIELPAPSIHAVPNTHGTPAPAPRWLSFDSIDAEGTYSATHILIDHARLASATRTVELHGSLDAVTGPFPPHDLPSPDFDMQSNLRLHVSAYGIDLNEIYALAGTAIPVTGTLATQFDANGPLRSLNGTGWAELTSAVAYGETISRIHLHGSVNNSILNVSSLIVNAPEGSLSAAGSYSFANQQYTFNARGAGLQLTRFNALKSLSPYLSGTLSFAAEGAGSLSDPRFQVRASIDKFLVANTALPSSKPGTLILTATAASHAVNYDAQASVDSASLSAHGTTAFTSGLPTQARLNLSHLSLPTIFRLANIDQIPAVSSIDGTFNVTGPLAHPDQLRGEATLSPLSATIFGVQLRSDQPIHASLAQNLITLDPIHITGDDTNLNIRGDLSLANNHPLNFNASGNINLKLVQTLDRDVTASGLASFKIRARGTLANPGLAGTIDFQDGNLALEDITNGLSQIHGTLEFNQNRLEVRSLTAMSGGGQLSLSGYLAYQNGLYSDLAVTGKSIRIRYPQGVSAIADTTLRLQGIPSNLLLSGNVLVTRFSINPDLDIAALAAQSNAVSPLPPLNAPSNHIRLDIHILSSPQLSFQNAFAKLAGNVDLRLRGTLANPSLLGNIAVTEGSATIAGTHYDLENGEIIFDNPVRIQPIINLNATARVQDYEITLGIHGSFNTNSITYRSEPPLPQADVIALLALGHTNEQQRLYTQQQETAANSTDALLGGALNATVSNRVQKLFGAGTVKVDPTYLGANGTSTSRVTVVEQVGRSLTFTFATNANTTSQQLIQAEIAINTHVSLLVARDESGVFSMVVKATRRRK